MGRFEGQVALVTGGGRGIGESTARLLAAEGAEVVVADVLVDEARAVASDIGGSAVELDVVDPAAWAVVAARRPFTIAVLNAGVGARLESLSEVPDGMFERVMAVNATGVYLGTRELDRHMGARGGGAISVTASIAGLVAHTQSPIYAASKWAVIGWVRSIAPMLAAGGVRINAVCPGLVDTPILGPGGADLMRGFGLHVLDPAEVAEAHAGVLLGDATGTCVTVQGRGTYEHVFAGVEGYQG